MLEVTGAGGWITDCCVMTLAWSAPSEGTLTTLATLVSGLWPRLTMAPGGAVSNWPELCSVVKPDPVLAMDPAMIGAEERAMLGAAWSWIWPEGSCRAW